MIRIMKCCLGLSLLFLPLCGSSPLAGWVMSPGYPRGYVPFSSLKWSRCAPPGHMLSLTFTHLDLEDSQGCENDAVLIFSDGSPLSTLCGRKSSAELQTFINPSLHSSSGGCLNLSFSADYSNTERHTGFRGFYTIKDVDECADPDNECSHFCNNFIGGYRCTCRPGYLLNADRHTCTVSCREDFSGSLQGVVRPPEMEGFYVADALCSYTLSVDEGRQLVLSFTGDFDVEVKDGKCIDTLMIRTGRSGALSFGPYCGHNAPGPISTNSNQAEVLFTSDGAGSNRGFTLNYKTRAMTCHGQVTPKSSSSPPKSEYEYGTAVLVTCFTGYHINEATSGAVIVTTFESECQKNGQWSPIYECLPVDCGEPSLPELLRFTNKDLGTIYKDEIQLECESEYYTMEGDDAFTCNASGDWVSRNGGTKLPKCVPVCGLTDNEVSGGGRILGGKKVDKIGEIPWQLLIKQPRGGASLITDRWAVTAAHVVEQRSSQSLLFYGGMIDGLDQNAVTMETEKIIIHPGYKQGVSDDKRVNYDNDIALLKMRSRVELNSNILPICLPERVDGTALAGKVGTVSGFGRFERADKSRYLRQVSLEVKRENECANTPMLGSNKMVYTKNMFCAGLPQKDSCDGDSGGPLFLPKLGNKQKQDRYRLVGIVSWGKKCQDTGYYTKVQNYLDWIKETIENN